MKKQPHNLQHILHFEHQCALVKSCSLVEFVDSFVFYNVEEKY